MTPITITTLELGDLSTNCYLVSCDETQETVIIDPADAGEFIADQITVLGLKPTAIVLTHGHFDHVLGTLSLALAYDLPVYLHPADHFLLDKAQQSAEYWLGRAVDPVLPAELTLDIRETPVFGDGLSFSYVETPGHTPGSVCLEVLQHGEPLDQPIMLVGDTLFKAGVGRTDFSYSSHEDLKKSLKLLSSRNPDTLCYPGHGEPTTIGNELKTLL